MKTMDPGFSKRAVPTPRRGLQPIYILTKFILKTAQKQKQNGSLLSTNTETLQMYQRKDSAKTELKTSSN